MNGYLFDTDALSQPLKKKPSGLFIHKMEGIRASQQFTSAVTAAEMLYGAHRLPSSSALLQQVQAVLASVRILPFDHQAASVFGLLRARLEKRGAMVAHSDLMIASVALSADLTLITGNTRHFERIPGLRIEDWVHHH